MGDGCLGQVGLRYAATAASQKLSGGGHVGRRGSGSGSGGQRCSAFSAAEGAISGVRAAAV